MPYRNGRPKYKKQTDTEKAISMSNRLYACMKMFEANPKGLPAMETLGIDQRSMGACYHRKWLDYMPNFDLFRINTEGRKAIYLFENTNVVKETTSIQFSHYIREISALSGTFKDMAPDGKRFGRAVVSIAAKAKHAVA